MLILLVGGLFPLRPAHANDPSGTSLSGSDVLARMAQVYRTCSSYRDTGNVRTVFIQDGKRRTEERPFKTAFVRPDSFRYEFTHSDSPGKTYRYIVWKERSEIREWWDVHRDVQTLPSLADGIAGATGVSGGSAHTVPALLLPEAVSGRSLKDMTDVKRLDDAPCGTASCAVVEGMFGDQKLTVWIDMDSFLLRRIDEDVAFPAFRTEDTTSYEPTVNVSVPSEILAFDPPQMQ